MATTKQVLRLQTDQILDDPQIGTRVRLKNLVATRAIRLTWVEPAASDWNIQFKDPTADDSVVYENLAQPLNNKSLGVPTITDFTNAQHTHASAAQGGPVSHAVLSNLTTGDDHTQYVRNSGRSGGQTIQGGTGASQNLSLESTSNVTKGNINALDSIVVSATKGIQVSGGGELTGLPAVPSGATAAASKAYVDASVSGGTAWRETLLSFVQLDNTNFAIAQGVAFYLVNNPIAGNTFVVRDGSTTETWTFQAIAGAFQPAIGGTALITMQNLAGRINTDSTKWAASAITTLQGINPVGNVVVIYRKVPTTITADRIYGTFTTPADAKYVNYGAQADYLSSVTANLPGADPVSANFGFGRITANLEPDEAHIVRAEDNVYLWNQDASAWQLTGGSVSLATSASGGGVIGQATYDSDKGLAVSAGVARVKVDGTTVSFDLSGSLSAAGAVMAPTGTVSQGVLLTRNIPAVTPPTSGFISSDIPVESYPDGSTTGQLFDFVVPADYDSGTIEILAIYQMSTSFVGNIRLETAAKIIKSSSGTIDSATFPAVDSTVTPPATSAITRTVIKTLPNPSGVNFQRGDTLQVYVSRLGADGADTHTGAWVVVAFEYRYTGQVSTRLMESVVDTFTPVTGEFSPSVGVFNSDISTISYSNVTNQSAAALFVVPDNWDGSSDAVLRLQYVLASAAGGTVRINTSGNIADVVGGSVVVIPSVNFDVAVSANTNPHRTTVIRSIAGSTLAPGDVIEIAIKRDTSVGGNAATAFEVITATMDFGTTPISGVSTRNRYYLSDGKFGNASGSVFGDSVYPNFATDFEFFFTMNSTGAAGVLHIAFEGRLDSAQTKIEETSIFVKGSGASPFYTLKIYAEGSGVVPVYNSGPTPAPGSSTEIIVPASSLSAQPTGTKRFFVVVESAIDAGETVLVGRPFVKVS